MTPSDGSLQEGIQEHLASRAREASGLPSDSAARKDVPMVAGLLDYFPAALAAVAEVSRIGNDKHNPGEPLHHARGKSMDHADCIVRHLVDRGSKDPEGVRHSAYAAWRALALLQQELEDEEGAPLPRGARAARSTVGRPPTRYDPDCGNCQDGQGVAVPDRPSYTVRPVPPEQYGSEGDEDVPLPETETTKGGW